MSTEVLNKLLGHPVHSSQVPMSQCRLVGYTECKMQDETVTYSETEVVTDGVFTKKECRTEFRQDVVIQGDHSGCDKPPVNIKT